MYINSLFIVFFEKFGKVFIISGLDFVWAIFILSNMTDYDTWSTKNNFKQPPGCRYLLESHNHITSSHTVTSSYGQIIKTSNLKKWLPMQL